MNNPRSGHERAVDTAPATHENRVAIIGCGRVGMASAYALIQSSFLRELILVDRSAEKAEGEAMDLRHAVAVPMTSPITIVVGGYAEAARSSIVVLTAGVASGDPDVSRLELLGQNVEIVRDIVGKLKAEGFAGILIVTSNPVDVLAKVAQESSGLPPGAVIGSGTLIDTARLRGMIGDALGVEPRAVDAYVIGEHGDSEIVAWSGVRVAGVSLDHFPGGGELDRDELLNQVRCAAPEIVRRKGATEYAIGLCVKRICEAVLRNERAALAVSTLLTGEYGIKDVYLGTPCIVGKSGVERVIALELDAAERKGLQASAALLRKTRVDLAE